MTLVIKKTVELESLGSEYKGISLTFKSIPAVDLTDIIKKTEKEEDNTVLISAFVEVLKKYFIQGTSNDGEVTTEDISQLDAQAVNFCFGILAGKDIDPKVEAPSMSTSTTEAS